MKQGQVLTLGQYWDRKETRLVSKIKAVYTPVYIVVHLVDIKQ